MTKYPAFSPSTARARMKASFAVTVALVAVGSLLQPFALTACAAPAGAEAASRAMLQFSHLPECAHCLAPLRATSGSETIGIEFALRPRNQAAIMPLLKSIGDPSSREYGRYLTPAEYADRFGPSQSQVDQVEAYAHSVGLTVTGASPSRLYVHASGTAAQMEAAFGVRLLDYASASPGSVGRVFRAPDREPSISAAVAPLLTGIVGLDDAGAPRSALRSAPTRFPAATPLGGIISGTGYADLSPYDVADLYSLGPSLKTDSGKRQVLGLLEFDTYYPSDVARWEGGYPLTSAFPAITPISVDQFDTATAPGSGQAEVTLDIDMLLNLAYDAEQIRVYEAGRNGTMIDIFDAMANDSLAPSVISSSWYIPETEVSQAYAQSEANVLQQLALQGQTVCECSDDSGAYADETVASPNAADPAAQQTVVAVGGVNMADDYNSDGSAVTLDSESSWYDSDDRGRGITGTGGGGGASRFWSIPDWQKSAFSLSVNPQGSASMRNVPDVSLYGDYDTGGYDVYLSSASRSNQAGWYAYNGTSAAAPLWAALLADANQARLAAGQPILGMATPQLYAVAESNAYAADFYDIDDGTTNGYYEAVGGFDNATGWGTPLDGSHLIADLAAFGKAPTLKSLNLAASSAAGGTAITGNRVFLSAGAPAATKIALSSSNAAAASVPASETVLKGSASHSFTVSTFPVSVPTTVILTASCSGVIKTAALTILPSLSSLKLADSSARGGMRLTGNRIYFSGSVSADAPITLTSSNTAVATVPSSETILKGSSSHSFTVTTKAVTSNQTVTITASSGGITKTATLTITP